MGMDCAFEQIEVSLIREVVLCFCKLDVVKRIGYGLKGDLDLGFGCFHFVFLCRKVHSFFLSG